MDVAVVIPAFNRSAMLARAVRSVLAQESRPSELVVVDDGSDENLSEIRGVVERAGFRWLDLGRNGGVAAARNAGVSASSAEWICFLDSDDEWDSAKLSRQRAWHRELGHFRISQVREQWLRDGRAVAKPSHWEPEEGDLFAEALHRCVIGPSCVMMRRDLWDEFGGFDPRFPVCEDYELWLRITRENPVGLVGGEALARKHAGHPDQLSAKVAAMDRYRIVALLELLSRRGLGDAQAELVVGVIRTKCRIVAEGAEKRGLVERANFYRSLSEAEVLGKASPPESILAEAWEAALD